MKKVLLSTLAMMAFFAGSLFLFIFVACSGQRQANEDKAQEETTETVIPMELEPEYDSMELVIPDEPEVVSTNSQKSSSYSSGSSYSYSCSDDDEDDYLEEQRKHSPNDNYLLGFDEDVDDVHDMELFIEDY